MLDIPGGAGTKTSESIPVDATTDVVALFLKLLLFPFELDGLQLKFDLQMNLELICLAEQFDAEEVEDLANQQISQLNPWDILQYANDNDNVFLARIAIERLHVERIQKWYEDDTVFWPRVKNLKVEWQLALIRCLAPTIDRERKAPRSAHTLDDVPVVLQYNISRVASHFNP